ncbi:MAG: hypothetical protein ACKPGI_05030, partial [Verrucomicrobiota bacterium]
MRRLESTWSTYFRIYGNTIVDAPGFPLPSLTDMVTILGFVVAVVGLGMNTFQVRLLVRQL